MPDPGTTKKTYFTITVDVDPDVNLPVPDKTGAVSHPVERGEVRFESCARGLEAIVKILNSEKICGTFFIESRTAEKLNSDFGLDLRKMLHGHEIGSHAYKHEDFLGIDSSVPFNKEQMIETLERSLNALSDIFNVPITGFRAPYVRINDMLASVLVEMGFEYDSSVTIPWHLSQKKEEGNYSAFQPYFYFETTETDIENPKALVEVPLPHWIMPDGKKLTSYLWPYIEGDLTFDEYNNAAEIISKMPPSNSIVLMATHPWHFMETYKQGLLLKADQDQLLQQFQSQIYFLKDKTNIEFITVSEYLDIWHSLIQKDELTNIFRNI